jgi:integrase
VAYAERRGRGRQPWRVKYKLPSGVETSESGFETKAAALAWGRDQEARIREGRWSDPDAGKTTVSEWIDRWLAMQDVGISTVEIREYLIRRFIRPAWGESELVSLTTEDITNWENAIPARTGVCRRTARDARALLCTILGDAAAAKPPLIRYNPAIRPRNRGRRTGRRLDRGPQRVWVTPLRALLVAERAALPSGRDEDLIMIVTIAYTGLRFGEVIGLEREHVQRDEIHVEWQLREIRSAFHRLPPKDDSYRSPNWAAQHGGSGHYVFLGADGGHCRRSNYARRVFRPACDGRYHPGMGKPARLVIADASAWPGVPVATWPSAQPGSGAFIPPRGRGIQPIPEDVPLACWLPAKFGLTPHGLRHSHKTWMAEDGIPEILAEQRLGHEVPGMRGLYAHASERMRDDLKHALQARWEESLSARATIHAHSPVPLLDQLLASFRDRGHQKSEPAAPRDTPKQPTTPGDREKMISQIPPNHAESPSHRSGLGLKERASDQVRDRIQRVELRGFEPLTPSMRTRCATGLRYSPKTASQRSKRWALFAPW